MLEEICYSAFLLGVISWINHLKRRLRYNFVILLAELIWDTCPQPRYNRLLVILNHISRTQYTISSVAANLVCRGRILVGFALKASVEFSLQATSFFLHPLPWNKISPDTQDFNNRYLFCTYFKGGLMSLRSCQFWQRHLPVLKTKLGQMGYWDKLLGGSHTDLSFLNHLKPWTLCYVMLILCHTQVCNLTCPATVGAGSKCDVTKYVLLYYE